MNILKAITKIIAVAHGLDPFMFSAQIGQESGYNPYAVSSAGAQGIAQFMPDTAKGLGIDPWNPVEALHAAAEMESKRIDAYIQKGHDLRTAQMLTLCEYNAGAGRVQQYGGCPPYAETQDYYRKIFNGASWERVRYQRKLQLLAMGGIR